MVVTNVIIHHWSYNKACLNQGQTAGELSLKGRSAADRQSCSRNNYKHNYISYYAKIINAIAHIYSNTNILKGNFFSSNLR